MPESEQRTPEAAPQLQPPTDYLAKGALWAANIISSYRVKQSVSVHKEIAENPHYQSWKLAGKVALTGALDWFDGKLSRFAARREGRETTAFGAALDELTDKAFTHGVLSGIVKREYLNQNYAYSSFLAVNQVIIAGRDVAVTQKRFAVRKLDVDTKAQPLGKYKTGLQNLNLALMCSPLTKGNKGKMAACAIQGFSTGLSLTSGISYFRSFNAAAEKARSAGVVPDFAEI